MLKGNFISFCKKYIVRTKFLWCSIAVLTELVSLQFWEEDIMIRQLQKIGNSKGVVLTRTMMDHLGVDKEVEVTMEDGRIILTALAFQALSMLG